MERIDVVVSMLSRTLDTRAKRHVLGGMLLSVSLLFGGLALTVVTLKTEEENE